MKKITKRERFAAIIANYNLSEDDKAFIEREMELLDKKNRADKKPTAAQEANVGFKNDIVDFLSETGGKFTISELWKNVPSLAEADSMTGQRISALVTQLKNSGTVVREEIKGKAYFSLA